MQAILTHTERKNGQIRVIATSASGKTRSEKSYSNPSEADHREVALSLSKALGFGSSLVGGETQKGFAYVPLTQVTTNLADVEKAAKTLMEAAQAFPNSYPTSIADGILKLAK